MNEICLNVACFVDKIPDYEIIPNHNIKSIINRFNEFNLILRLVIRCYDLAQSEFVRAFKIYKGIKSIQQDFHAKFELIGGIIYFLVVICFETFTPGLNEFLRLCLSDLREIVDYDPSLLCWIPELDLMHAILALNTRSDQSAIDDLLKLSIFEVHSLKPAFKNIISSSLNLLDFDEQVISVKLIQKYGNINIMSDFTNAFCIIKKVDDKFLELKNDELKFDDRIRFTDISLDTLSDLRFTNQWMDDFMHHLKHSREREKY